MKFCRPDDSKTVGPIVIVNYIDLLDSRQKPGQSSSFVDINPVTN